MSEKKVMKKTREKIAERKTEKVAKKTVDKTARKARKFNYKTWTLVGVAAIALVVVIVAIVQFGRTEKIESEYFRNSNDKIVITMDKEMAALDDSEYEPYITHVVYYYENDKITDLKAFYEYPDEKTAREAYENLGLGEFADGKRLNGRFVVFQVKRAQYDGVSVEELRQDIEAMKEIGALILDYEEGYINKYIEADVTIDESEMPSVEENSDESSDSDDSGAESTDTE